MLDVENLTVTYQRGGKPFRVIDGLNFSLEAGSVLGVVGESGSGKSTLAMALMGLSQRTGATIVNGSIWFKGEDLAAASKKRLRWLRSNELGLILQDPHSSLNPAYTVRNQCREGILVPEGNKGDDPRTTRAIESLNEMGLSGVESIWRKYPHQFSGGMKQRVVGAMGIANRPSLLIADEPTTALDVTVQAKYLETLRDLSRSLGVGIVLVTHDLGIVAEVCDHVMVMYAGRAVEIGPVERIFDSPMHPYTSGLFRSRASIASSEGSEDIVSIPGQPPRLWSLPPGCNFEPRCPVSEAACTQTPGDMVEIEKDHRIECFLMAESVLGSSSKD